MSLIPTLCACFVAKTDGGGVLNVSSSSDYLRVYSHCAKGKNDGSIAVLAINLSNKTTYEMHLGGISKADAIDAYVLTALDLSSQTVMLNGIPLQSTQAGGIPSLTPSRVPSPALVLRAKPFDRILRY